MRGSSTAGCIRGTETVSQVDSAAVRELAYGRIPNGRPVHQYGQLLIAVRRITWFQCLFCIVSMAESASPISKPYSSILSFLAFPESFSNQRTKMLGCVQASRLLAFGPLIYRSK
jgi:hypothetical protein